MVKEIAIISVSGVLTLAFICLVLYFVGKEMTNVFSCPYNKAKGKVSAYIDFNDYEVYYYIDGSWYFHQETSQIKHSWDEAKLAEPVSTLLTLIYKDYDNFIHNFQFNMQMLSFEHKILSSVSGSVESNTSCTVRMFDDDVLLNKTEANAIRHFFYYIQNNREILQKQAETERLQKEREAAAIGIVEKINDYLGEK